MLDFIEEHGGIVVAIILLVGLIAVIGDLLFADSSPLKDLMTLFLKGMGVTVS